MPPYARVGQTAPDFSLPLAAERGRQVHLSNLLGGRSLALVFGSYTWEPLRASADRLNEIAALNRKDVRFLFVYIREADRFDPANRGTREQMCLRTVDALGFHFHAVVDRDDDLVSRNYGAHPGRLVLVAPDGRVAFASERGQEGLDLDGLDRAIVELRAELEAEEAPAPVAPIKSPDGLFEALDRDADRALSPAEIDGAADVLPGLDLDGDGVLLLEELARTLQPSRPKPAEPVRTGEKGTGAQTPAARPPNPESGIESEPELAPPEQGEADPLAGRGIGSFDYDGDGRISRIEVPRSMLDRWDTYDTNDDGYLDRVEQAAMSSKRKRGPKQR